MSDILRAHGWKVGAGTYALVALFTFGHSASEGQQWKDRNCATIKQRAETPGTDCFSVIPLNAAFNAAVWPLYWSWELQTPSAHP